MSIRSFIIAVGIAAALAAPAPAQDANPMALASEIGAASLGVVTWEMDEGAGPQRFNALGACVRVDDEGRAILMAPGLSASAAPEDFMNIRVILPGADGAELKATLLGIDPYTSLAFVRTEEQHDWRPVEFADQSGVSVGDEVFSVGLLSSDLGRRPYVGRAYISTSIRTPDTVFMVAGGMLTEAGSLVFNRNGVVIGLVGRQMFGAYEMVLQGRRVNVPLRGRQWTDSFLPVEEFVEVLDRIPSSPDAVRQVPWIGALNVEAIERDLWVGYSLSSPGVRLHDVIPGYAAANAGLVDDDIIVKINGEPLEMLATPDLTAGQMIRNLSQRGVGGEVTIEFIRDGVTNTATMALAPWPMHPSQAERFIDVSLGIRVREKVELDRYLDPTPTADVQGLIVMFVAPNSPADRFGMKAGDLILSIGGQPVRTIEVYQELMGQQEATSVTNSIDILVRRGEQDTVISIRLN